MQRPALPPETYGGREQAFVKHRLLESYLQKLFLIVGAGSRGKSIELCYVDCFAGPWSVDTETLEGTSIAVSLQTLSACRHEFEKLGVRARIRALYVEKDPQAYRRLEQHLNESTPDGIQSRCMEGDFVALRDDILAWCGQHAFTFFFIDPKGWKDIGVQTLRPLLQRPHSEFLINFAYMFVNRTIAAAEQQERMFELIGREIDLTGLAPEEREQRIVDAYRHSLKQCVPRGQQGRAAYVRVLDPNQDRPKYHLVYVTCHPRGIIEFMEISDHVDLIQKQVRAAKRTQRRAQETGMDDMFGSETLVDPAAGHGSSEDVDRFWIDYLARGVRQVGAGEFAEILEQTNWFPRDLQESLARLIAANRVRNLDALRARPKAPLHWKSNERLQLLEQPR